MAKKRKPTKRDQPEHKKRTSRQSPESPTAPKTPQPEELPSPPLDPTMVRTALLHLAQLAAAYDGRGIELPEDQESEKLQLHDLRVLEDVTHQLLRHRESQLRKQRQGYYHGLVALLTDDFRVAVKAKASAREGMRESLGTFGIRPTEGELSKLEEDLKRTISGAVDNGGSARGEARNVTDHGGAREAVKAGLERSGTHSARTLAHAVSLSSAPLIRPAFRRWAPGWMVREYLLDVLEEASFTSRAITPVTLKDLANPAESVVATLDAIAEAHVLRLLRARWTGWSRPDQEDFKEAVAVRASGLREQASRTKREVWTAVQSALNDRQAWEQGEAPEASGHGVGSEFVKAFPEGLQRPVRDYATARLRGDTRAIGAAEGALDAAIYAYHVELFWQRFTGGLPLSTS